MIRTVLFDLGNVLVYFSHERMCAQIADVCGRDASEVRELLLDGGLQWAFERGDVSEAEFHRRLEKATGRTIDFDALRRAASDIFELNTSVVPVVDALKKRGHRLVLLSNTNRLHFEFVRERFDILDRFDEFVLSFEVGAIKPERSIFEVALDKIECRPQECFYTDDTAGHVEAGRRFGLDAEVFTDTETLLGHLRQRGIAWDA